MAATFYRRAHRWSIKFRKGSSHRTCCWVNSHAKGRTSSSAFFSEAFSNKPGGKHSEYTRFAKDPQLRGMPAHGSYKSALQKKFGRPRWTEFLTPKTWRILYQRKSDYRNGYRISYPCKKKQRCTIYHEKFTSLLTSRSRSLNYLHQDNNGIYQSVRGPTLEPWQVFSSQITNRLHCSTSCSPGEGRNIVIICAI